MKGLKHCNTIYRKKDGYYERDDTGNRFIKALQLFKMLINSVGDLISPMPLIEEVMRTQFYDKVDEYNTFEYTEHSYRQEEYTEQNNHVYNIFFDFIDMLNALPTDNNEIWLIAHNSDYDCRFVFQYLQNVKLVLNGGIFFTN